MNQKILSLLQEIYGAAAGTETARSLALLLEEEGWASPPPGSHVASGLPLDERDVFVITYGDSLTRSGAAPLACLKEFGDSLPDGTVSGLHLLPFFPYSSDDGFSVIDYYRVNPALGTWEDVNALRDRFTLMSDLVLNHCSVHSEWFTRFLARDPAYRDFFITADPHDDLSGVFRPRTHPLLTRFDSPEGPLHVWTTFSADQADLNFANPEVLVAMIKVLFFHVRMGVRVVRLDAIAYLWKELGHSCLHHPKTHAVVKLLRALLDAYAPGTVLLTETNVPHKENISYFGDGTNEAHMVYNFSLPPLVLDAFLRGDAGHLRAWAAGLPQPDGRTTFFNFLASHDGIGLLPAKGILSPQEADGLAAQATARGGRVNFKATPDGPVPYELNITYVDAIAGSAGTPETRARRFLASQAVMLSLPGIPGIYIGSLIGSTNWEEGVRLTGANRSINRQKLPLDEVLKEIGTPGTFRQLVFDGYLRMLKARGRSRAFDPAGGMEMLPAEGAVFAVMRHAPLGKGTERVLCVVNTGSDDTGFFLPRDLLAAGQERRLVNLVRGNEIGLEESGDRLVLRLEPLAVYWLAC